MNVVFKLSEVNPRSTTAYDGLDDSNASYFGQRSRHAAETKSATVVYYVEILIPGGGVCCAVLGISSAKTTARPLYL
jgi:hypothetical protein